MADLGVTPDAEAPRADERPTRTVPRGRFDVAPGLAAAAVVAAAAALLASFSSALSPLVVGVVLGALVVNARPMPSAWQPGVRFATRSILRTGVVLLGFRLSLADVADLGTAGVLVVAAVVAVTFFGTRWLGRRLGVSDDVGLLVATGYSICGASAIAAMDGVTRSEEEETAYAIALVTLCGTLSIAALPLLAEPLGFAGEAFGTWVGAAVHDVGQVVAAAATDGDDAIAAATVVKLSRVVLLAPLVAAVALSRRRRAAATAATAATAAAHHGEATDRPPLVPLFVVGFLAAIAIRTTGVLGDAALGAIADAEKIALTVALVALGMGVRVANLRTLGGRPLVLGLLAWVLVAGTAAVGTIVVT